MNDRRKQQRLNEAAARRNARQGRSPQSGRFVGKVVPSPQQRGRVDQRWQREMDRAKNGAAGKAKKGGCAVTALVLGTAIASAIGTVRGIT